MCGRPIPPSWTAPGPAPEWGPWLVPAHVRVPLAVFWDMESCPLPADVAPDAVARNVRQALRLTPATCSAHIAAFSAYADFSLLPRKVREGCQRTGVNLHDVPSGRKDAVDKAILADLFLFAMDHTPPAALVLVSADVDFATSLHKLAHRGYTVCLALPKAGPDAGGWALGLTSAVEHVWEWEALAAGLEAQPAAPPSASCPLAAPASPLAAASPPTPASPSAAAATPDDDGEARGSHVPSNPSPPRGQACHLGHGSEAESSPSEHSEPISEVNLLDQSLFFSDAADSSSDADESGVGSAGEDDDGSSMSTPVGVLCPKGVPSQGGEEKEKCAGITWGGSAWGAVLADKLVSPESEGAEYDIAALQAQLCQVVRNHGGHEEIEQMPGEYGCMFLVPYVLGDHGVASIAPLVHHMRTCLEIGGTGPRKWLVLRPSAGEPEAVHSIHLRTIQETSPAPGGEATVAAPAPALAAPAAAAAAAVPAPAAVPVWSLVEAAAPQGASPLFCARGDDVALAVDGDEAEGEVILWRGRTKWSAEAEAESAHLGSSILSRHFPGEAEAEASTRTTGPAPHLPLTSPAPESPPPAASAAINRPPRVPPHDMPWVHRSEPPMGLIPRANAVPAGATHGSGSGPLAVFWDIENCCLPSDVPADTVGVRIRNALRAHPATAALPIALFAAYGDFSLLPRRIREGCQRTGIDLVDVPNGRKDAADKAIMADLFLFALDHAASRHPNLVPPCTVLLISSDVDFATALHKLTQRGVRVLLSVLGNGMVSRYLTSAAEHVWDWGCLARGRGCVIAQAARAHGHPMAVADSPVKGMPSVCQPMDEEGLRCCTGRAAECTKEGEQCGSSVSCANPGLPLEGGAGENFHEIDEWWEQAFCQLYSLAA